MLERQISIYCIASCAVDGGGNIVLKSRSIDRKELKGLRDILWGENGRGYNYLKWHKQCLEFVTNAEKNADGYFYAILLQRFCAAAPHVANLNLDWQQNASR